MSLTYCAELIDIDFLSLVIGGNNIELERGIVPTRQEVCILFGFQDADLRCGIIVTRQSNTRSEMQCTARICKSRSAFVHGFATAIQPTRNDNGCGSLVFTSNGAKNQSSCRRFRYHPEP